MEILLVKYLMDFIIELELQNPIRLKILPVQFCVLSDLDFETRRPSHPRGRQGDRGGTGPRQTATGTSAVVSFPQAQAPDSASRLIQLEIVFIKVDIFGGKYF